MLPPFVPPSARAVAEPLPLITEFVLHRAEQTGAGTMGTTAVMEAPAPGGTSETWGAALPLITEFAVSRTYTPRAPEPGIAATADEVPPLQAQAMAAAVGTGSEWIDEERNAFDWQSIAGLATPASEARRAKDEWDSTQWDRPVASPSEHVASLLAQIARRVRSGELKVDGGRGMSTEAALAATLAALLRSEGE